MEYCHFLKEDGDFDQKNNHLLICRKKNLETNLSSFMGDHITLPEDSPMEKTTTSLLYNMNLV